MGEIGPEIIVAVGGTILLVATAFRYLVNTVIKLNDELQEVIVDRRQAETERRVLQNKVSQLEGQLTQMQNRLDAQAQEIRTLHERLRNCDELVTALQGQAEVSTETQ